MLYERKEPLVHTLHEEQSKLLKQFLACFIKTEILLNKSVKELLELDLTKNNMKTADMFIGSTTRGIINETKSPNSDPFVKEFLIRTVKTFQDCGAYLQKKLPIKSKLLHSIVSINPEVRH